MPTKKNWLRSDPVWLVTQFEIVALFGKAFVSQLRRLLLTHIGPMNQNILTDADFATTDNLEPALSC